MHRLPATAACWAAVAAIAGVRRSGFDRRKGILVRAAQRCALHRFSSQACGSSAALSDAAVVSN
jgi:hypothetical protein